MIICLSLIYYALSIRENIHCRKMLQYFRLSGKGKVDPEIRDREKMDRK